MPEGASGGCRLGVAAASFAFRRLTVDVGLLPLGTGPHALAAFVDALQSLAFTLDGRALTFVRALFSFVRQPFAVIRNALALLGDPVSSARLKFASFEVSLTLGEGLFAFIQLVSPAFQLCGGLETILSGHNSP